MLTPERLAEMERWADSPPLAELKLSKAEEGWIQGGKNTAKVLIAHIRDLEAQAREVPSIDDCLYHRCVEHWTVPGRNTTASSNGAECGACIERDWRSAFENYATHHGWCASGHGGMHVLGSPGSCDCGRDARLATATPPSLSAKERQRRSFAYGNVHIDNPNVTREMVDRAAERLASEPPSPEVGE